MCEVRRRFSSSPPWLPSAWVGFCLSILFASVSQFNLAASASSGINRNEVDSVASGDWQLMTDDKRRRQVTENSARRQCALKVIKVMHIIAQLSNHFCSQLNARLSTKKQPPEFVRLQWSTWIRPMWHFTVECFNGNTKHAVADVMDIDLPFTFYVRMVTYRHRAHSTHRRLPSANQILKSITHKSIFNGRLL